MTCWILVTGFGPFQDLDQNPSWLAVDALPDSVTVDGRTVRLLKIQLEVDYRHLDAIYAMMRQVEAGHDHCDTHQDPELRDRIREWGRPECIVHVGVSGLCSRVHVERTAYNECAGVDNRGFTPPHHRVVPGEPAAMVRQSRLPCKRIVEHLRDWGQSRYGMQDAVQLSDDPGRYLCNYSYYHALSWMRGQALFVHVPPLDRPFSARDLTRILHALLLNLFAQSATRRENEHRASLVGDACETVARCGWTRLRWLLHTCCIGPWEPEQEASVVQPAETMVLLRDPFEAGADGL